MDLQRHSRRHLEVPQSVTTRSPLHGIIVTELGGRIGAGVCGSILAQLGATVTSGRSAPGQSKSSLRRASRCETGRQPRRASAICCRCGGPGYYIKPDTISVSQKQFNLLKEPLRSWLIFKKEMV